jgi:malate synthase
MATARKKATGAKRKSTAKRSAKKTRKAAGKPAAAKRGKSKASKRGATRSRRSTKQTRKKQSASRRAGKAGSRAKKSAGRSTRALSRKSSGKRAARPGSTKRSASAKRASKARAPVSRVARARAVARSSSRGAGQASRPAAPTASSLILDVAKQVVKRTALKVVDKVLTDVQAAGVAALQDVLAPKTERSGERNAGIAVTGAMDARYDEILTPDALAFLAALHREFEPDRRALLQARVDQQRRYDAGALPDFLSETREIRDSDWRVGAIPADLQDRRVEITGPVDRKMVINALNSGANVYMADFEDANSPTWANNLEGQINLKDRWDGTLEFSDPETGKDYQIADQPAVLIVRPRGWHLEEAHLTIDGEPISGALFDFGLYFFHNARRIIEQGSGPYFYLPKLETHLEARLWDEVFLYAEDEFGLPAGTIKATVLIETLPAAFEMDEILWELRDHIVGLNAGRWDYIFSFIKKLRKNPDYVLPDRGQVVMGKAFLRAYALLLVRTCHRRGAFAMGGMAAQIPVRGDEAANEAAFARVRADKEREANEGHDGTWVAHPGLVDVAKEVFDRMMPGQNQLDRLRDDISMTAADLLKIHEGTRTEEGFRHNIRVGIQYIEAWLRGRGAVPIYNLMEDAATAEISRAQIWQWIKYGVELDTGVTASPAFFREALHEEMQRVREEIGAEAYDNGRFEEAIGLFSKLSLSDEFEEFLTIPAYRLIM